MASSRIGNAVLLVALILLSTTARSEESECAIVYGKNWAFLFSAPKSWKVDCPIQNPSGIVVALWPEGTTFANAPGIMYVTVSQKNSFSLEKFAEDELARFREQSPNLQVELSNSIALPNKSKALVRKLTGDQFGNHELIAYVDGGTVYLILVLSSRTQESFEHLRSAFGEFVSSIQPMNIKFGNAEKPPQSTPEGKQHDKAVQQPSP